MGISLPNGEYLPPGPKPTPGDVAAARRLLRRMVPQDAEQFIRMLGIEEGA